MKKVIGKSVRKEGGKRIQVEVETNKMGIEKKMEEADVKGNGVRRTFETLQNWNSSKNLRQLVINMFISIQIHILKNNGRFV